MTRRGVMGLLSGGAAVLLGGCGLFGGGSYRFKMTVEVETPQGVRTGSSVYEVSARNALKLLPDEGVRDINERGEAVVVDLDGGALFVLMKFGDGGPTGLAEMSMRTLDPEFRNMTNSVESAGRISGWSQREGEVRPEHYPLLVRFRDIRDPKSVERVDPGDLAKSFGTGVRLRAITISVTDDPVTSGIEKRLGWLGSHQGSLDYTGRLHPDAPEKDVTRMAFVQGITK